MKVTTIAVAAVAATSSSLSCSAFNSMITSSKGAVTTTLRTPAAVKVTRTTTRLYDAYDDQYAKFYNRAPTSEEEAAASRAPTAINGDTGEAAVAAAAEEQPQEMFAETPFSYGNNGVATEQQQQQQLNFANGAMEAQEEEGEIYYESTNSYEAPPQPVPVVSVSPPQIPKSDPIPEVATAFGAAPPDQPPKFETTSSPTLSSSSPTLSASSNTLSVVTALPKLEKGKVIPFGEASRKFRRTVYSHEDWVNHRSPDRFFKYVVNIVNSGVYKNVGREVLVLTFVTLFVMLYNGCVLGYQDLSGAFQPPIFDNNLLPPLILPLQPFTLSSSSLGLLVAFRSNTAYTRWDEARKNWGMNINHTRDLNRMANAYYDRTGVSDEKRAADLERVSLCTWAFVRAMKRHLSPEAEDESAFKAELYEKLPKTQAAAIIRAAHRPNRALYDLSMAIENLPMHFLRKNEMHAALTIFEDNLGSSERLLTSPVPLIYNRHTARFLLCWVMLLPFALYEPFGNMWNHVGLLPTMAMLGLMLFGIEELATQLEEPFTVLPMQAFCDKIGNWCNEISTWEDGTNGLTTHRSYQGRTKV